MNSKQKGGVVDASKKDTDSQQVTELLAHEIASCMCTGKCGKRGFMWVFPDK